MVVLLVNGPAAKAFAVEPIRTIIKLIMTTIVWIDAIGMRVIIVDREV